MIKPIRYDSGKIDTVLTAASTTITKFDLLDFSSGYAQRATSGTTVVHLMALEDKVTASATHHSIDVLWLSEVECEGETASTATQALVGTYIDLTDHDTLNQAASSTNVFLVHALVGTTKVRGVFVQNVA